MISTPVGGILEAVHHDSTGLIVEPGDVDAIARAVALLASDSKLRERMAKASHALFEEKFDLDAIVEQVMGIYGELLWPAA